jgi:hypothetical protein
MDFLLWLEETRIAQFVSSGNTILAYPTILFLHTLGLASVAGFSAFVSLRVLGFAPAIPLSAVRPFIRIIWIAFAVTAASGTALLMAAASSKAPTPIFLIKMTFVGLAVTTVHLLTKQVFGRPEDQSPLPPRARVLACASMLLWVAATTAGRLMAYIV